MSDSLEQSPRRKQAGRPRLPAEDQRRHTVSVRLSEAEAAELDRRRAAVRMSRGTYLRVAVLQVPPRSVPPINQEAWAELAHAASNLNRIGRRLARGQGARAQELLEAVLDCRTQLGAVRNGLIGAREGTGRGKESEDDEDED